MMSIWSPESFALDRYPLAMGQGIAERPSDRFEIEAGGVLANINRAFAQVLASLGVRRPVELQKALKLDKRLSWQICKVAGDAGGGLSSGPLVPSRQYVSRFIDGATAAGVPASEVAFLTESYDQFEDLVQRHAGDRTSFNSLAAASAGGLTDEWFATDLQHRRNMFRGECHAMGVHAQTRVMSALLERRADGTADFRLLSISGFVGLRVLRPMERVRIHGRRATREDAEGAVGSSLHKPLSMASKGGFLLEDYSTQPLPDIQVQHNASGEKPWVETFLIRPALGNLGLTTVMFGEHHLLDAFCAKIRNLLLIPVEVAILDLLVEPGLLPGPPTLSVFRGDDQHPARTPYVVPVLGDHKLQSLGRGTGRLATADIPRYPDLVRAAAADLSGDVETFDAYRVRLEYPLYHSTISLQLGEPAASPREGSPAAG